MADSSLNAILLCVSWLRQFLHGVPREADVFETFENLLLAQPGEWSGTLPGQTGYKGLRNTMIGPRLISLDFTLTKRFQMGEEKDLTFRAEFFNLLNRPNLGLPEADVFDPDAAGDGITRYLPHAGRIPGDETTTTARQIQFGLKFTF